MDRHVILVETTPTLWENIQVENRRRGQQIDIKQTVSRPLAKRGFSYQEYDYTFAAKAVLDYTKSVLGHDGVYQHRFQLEDFWTTIKNNFHVFRQVDAMMSTDKQILIFHTVFDVKEIDDYVSKAANYRQQMGYNDNVQICRIRLSHDGNETLDKWYDYLITCSGDWDFMLKDLDVAIEDYIEHDVFLEPREAKKREKDETPITKILKEINKESIVESFNPFGPRGDWKQYEFPKPKPGEIYYWMNTEYTI